MAIATYNTKLDDDFEIMTDDPGRAGRRSKPACARSKERIEGDMDPYKAAAQMDTDEIVCGSASCAPWLEALAEMCVPDDRLPPRQEPAHLVAARHQRALGASRALSAT